MLIKMTEDRFRKYDELEDDEKEVLDVFRQMKLLADYNKFKLYKYKVEDLIESYDTRKNIGIEGMKTVFKYSSENISKKWFKLIEKK